jgi:hypothetical protein
MYTLDSITLKSKIIFDLVLNWIAERVRLDERSLQELCEYVCIHETSLLSIERAIDLIVSFFVFYQCVIV